MKPSKTHELRIVVRFDQPVTKTQAAYMAGQCIHGDFYPYLHDGAEEMKVVRITKPKAAPVK